MYSTDKELDQVWINYNNHVIKKPLYINSYQQINRQSVRAHSFEWWLYNNGAEIVQKNYKRFIKFNTNEQAIMFLLTWS